MRSATTGFGRVSTGGDGEHRKELVTGTAVPVDGLITRKMG